MWDGTQNEKLNQIIIAKILKGNKRQQDVTRKLVEDCKSLSDQFIKVKELENRLQRSSELQEFVFKTEMAYYVKTQIREVI